MDEMRTRLFYSVSAWCLITAFAGNVLLYLTVELFGPEILSRVPWIVKILLGLVGAGGAFGFFALWLGMIWHCSAVWRVGTGRKIRWLLLLLLTMPIGSLIYYFAIFRETA
jgi:hypothetical protein